MIGIAPLAQPEPAPDQAAATPSVPAQPMEGPGYPHAAAAT